MADTRPIVTLLTDFGRSDYYVAAVKGVLLSRAPECSLVDISHDVAPGDIPGGAFVLGAACRWFPPRTVHLAVVDPGVGGSRRILVVESPQGRFVGPDNGLLTSAFEDGTVRWVQRRDLFLSGPGNTFHGRDRFAPVAAYLATGGATKDLGPVVEDARRLQLDRSRRGPRALEGRIVHIDQYGNLVTNLPSAWLEEGRPEGATVGDHRACRFVSHYQELPPGEAGVLPGSLGTLELSIDGASLADRWAAKRGDRVVIEGTWPSTE